MPAQATMVSRRPDTAAAPAARRDAPREQPAPPPREQPRHPVERPSAPKKAPHSARQRRVRWVLFALLPLALIAGGYWYVTGGRVMSTDNAYVEADKVGISTDISGIVKEIDVGNNQHVENGQVLFRLDDLPFRLAFERSDAQVGVVRNDLNALKANYRDMQAQIKQAQDDIDYYDREFHRQQDLAAKNIASQQTFDTARRNLANAPFAGIVTNVPAIAPGKYLQASMTAFYLVATDYVWVDANPKETELTNVRPAQLVTVTVDTYPNLEWHGKVESISPAAAQEFSLLPAQNTSGNWVKVVQRIPMRVHLDTSDKNLPPLRAGMSVEVNVDTGHQRGLPQFLTALL